MKLRAGLLHDSSAWRQIFRQEGFPIGMVDPGQFNPGEWSVVVINRPPDEREALLLSGYLKGGGAILTCGGYGRPVLGTDAHRVRVEYLTSQNEGLFEDTGILDVGTECVISREANQLYADNGSRSVFAGEWNGGHVVDLPFDPAELMFDTRSTMRLFYSTGERLPSETVSFVDKGELRHLLHRALEFLHHARGLPYAHLWYFPGGAENCLAFRIDTDGAPKEDVEELYALSLQKEVPFTWYLDVRSHEDWLEVFGAMHGQEIGVHCYEHRTFETTGENVANIGHAIRLMEQNGLSAGGFAAPYGQWNPGLGDAIDGSGFPYSSEFSYAFDTLPLYPEANGKRFTALQVPIHPVCIGSMLRVGYTTEQMKEYFVRSVGRKLIRNEPLFYYHHPAHRCFDVVEALLDAARLPGIAVTTLGDFARWWKKRGEVNLEVEFDGMNTQFHVGTPEVPEPWIRISTGDGMTQRVPLSSGSASRAAGEWKPVRRISPPRDIIRIREFDPRAQFADWFNTILRKIR